MKENRAGMTLIEALIAIVIFGMVIAGFCNSILCVKKMRDISFDHYMAVNIAKNRIERARTLPYENLSSFAESALVIDQYGFLASTSDEGRFERTTEISVVSSNLTEIFVIVRIRDRETLQFGDEKETLKSYIVEIPPTKKN